MPASEAQRAAQRRYNDKAYDRFAILVRKGTRDVYKQAANSRGLSLAKFAVAAMEEYIINHPVEGE